MEIRTFAEADRARVIELWSLCSLTRPWNDPDKDIDRKLHRDPTGLIVGEMPGEGGDEGSLEIAATIMFGYDGHRGFANYLAVDPASRGLGLGRVMMEEVEIRLLAMGCPKINLQIRKDNVGVISLYEHLGYVDDNVASMGKRLISDI
jgi:ribosomal protein S18 acetylase RimI-like enzyme